MHIQMKKLTVVRDEVWDLAGGNVSPAVVIQLKARIARRESRRKQLPFDLSAQEHEPQLQPAA